MTHSIFIFRRSLRLEDNLGLIRVLQSDSQKVIPVFIFTKEQLDRSKNEYFSDNCVQFMMESLNELDAELQKHGSRLFYLYDINAEVALKKFLTDLVEKGIKVTEIVVNMDYTPYSRNRDKMIKEVAGERGIEFVQVEDLLLNRVASILTGSGKVYSKFTPYFNKASLVGVPHPVKLKPADYKKFLDQKIEFNTEFKGKLEEFYQNNPNNLNHGGRSYALKIINPDNLKNKFATYNKTRNFPNISTTQLSAYIKFGNLSIREIYWAFYDNLGTNNELIKQLYWRDFYYNIVYDNPEILGSGVSLKTKYDKIMWENNLTDFEKWKNGQTGFPLVDAGIREMNATGFMHNRVRMVTANHLVKLLLIDWRWGEKYFAQTLYDYDPSVNNGNWQWVAGSGADAQPYFRIFNPWSQSEKFDKKAEYIKKWVPELKNVPAEHIHQWDENWKNYPKLSYPKPMIDYKSRRDIGLETYKKILN